jgi:hypothetical protein
MSDAGIKVTLEKNGQGELSVVQFSMSTYSYILYRTPDGSGGAMMSGDDPKSDDIMNDFFSSDSTDPALIIDGVDYSDAYTHCLKESGYDENLAWGNGGWGMDPEYTALQVEANNKWAACARENNWPAIKDSSMPVGDSKDDWPTVSLPTTITEDQLRTLLKACPNFDSDAQDMLEQWWQNPTATGYPPGWTPDPSISIEWPDSPGKDPESTMNPGEQAEMDRINRLYEILYEAQQAYWDNKWGND